jgi:phosphatidylinositol alpha-1,6-mannosyltransferase
VWQRLTRSAVLDWGTGERVRILYPGVTRASAPVNDGRVPRVLRRFSRVPPAELYKGHDTTIRALPLVKAKCPDVRYVIAGDGPLRDYLGRVAESVGVERDVRFLGEVTDDELPDLYRSCDAVVLLGRESLSEGGAEGFGIVCLEAGACGKPVVRAARVASWTRCSTTAPGCSWTRTTSARRPRRSSRC